MASDTTLVLIDARDERRVVPHAWPVPALRPYLVRWCPTCATEDCIWPGHALLTFTASRPTAAGWEYRSPSAWPTPERPAQAAVAHVINDRGDVVGTVSGEPPWPETMTWQGRACDLWCRDARGIVLYRVKDA